MPGGLGKLLVECFIVVRLPKGFSQRNHSSDKKFLSSFCTTLRSITTSLEMSVRMPSVSSKSSRALVAISQLVSFQVSVVGTRASWLARIYRCGNLVRSVSGVCQREVAFAPAVLCSAGDGSVYLALGCGKVQALQASCSPRIQIPYPALRVLSPNGNSRII